MKNSRLCDFREYGSGIRDFFFEIREFFHSRSLSKEYPEFPDFYLARDKKFNPVANSGIDPYLKENLTFLEEFTRIKKKVIIRSL